MDRHDIIGEIRRTARDGRALGKMAFERETGIKESGWSGKYWARWWDSHRAHLSMSPSRSSTIRRVNGQAT